MGSAGRAVEDRSGLEMKVAVCWPLPAGSSLGGDCTWRARRRRCHGALRRSASPEEVLVAQVPDPMQRHRLRVELREARLEASLTQRDAAAELGWSESKLLRI